MCKGRILFSLFLIAVGAYAVYSAWGWTFKAGLFPLAVSIPLIVLTAAQLLLDLFGKAETAKGPSVDLEFGADVPLEIARRRVTNVLLWIGGFIWLVFLLGFPAAVPVFMLSYLGLQSRAGWWQSIGITVAAWGFFYIVFQRVIMMQFEAGMLQSWLGL
jgi:hypothetical protein